MNTHATALSERCNTLIIFIWSFTLMWMHIDNKISVYWKRFTTQNTLLWVFTSMYTQMFCKITVQNEILITLSAFTRFFSSMQPQMFYEITVLYEILLTKSAFIRFFSNMYMHGMHECCSSLWKGNTVAALIFYLYSKCKHDLYDYFLWKKIITVTGLTRFICFCTIYMI